MEWAPKFLDSLDSAALALHQSWAGYYRWVFFRLVLTILAVAAMVFSPAIRILAIAIVTTYVCAGIIDRLVSNRKRSLVATAGSRPR